MRGFVLAGLLMAGCVPAPEGDISTLEGGSMAGNIRPEWILTQMDGHAAAISASLLLESASSFSGQAPCNTYSASYSQSGAAVSIGPLVTTKMACEHMADETVYLNALQGVTEIVGASNATLTLRGGGHELVFMRPVE